MESVGQMAFQRQIEKGNQVKMQAIIVLNLLTQTISDIFQAIKRDAMLCTSVCWIYLFIWIQYLLWNCTLFPW